VEHLTSGKTAGRVDGRDRRLVLLLRATWELMHNAVRHLLLLSLTRMGTFAGDYLTLRTQWGYAAIGVAAVARGVPHPMGGGSG
jgi:hypothetical protein